MEMEILFPRTRSKVLGACPPLTKCGQYGVTPDLNFIVPQVEATFQGQGKTKIIGRIPKYYSVEAPLELNGSFL